MKLIKNCELNKKYIIFSILSLLALVGSLSITFTSNLEVKLPSTPDNAVKIEYYLGNYSWFFYFTDISNSLFVVVTTIHVFYVKKPWLNRLQTVVCSYMIFVGLAYWTLLAPVEITYWAKMKDDSMFPEHFFIYYLLNCFFVHVFNVILAIILLFKFVNRKNINVLRTAFFAMIYPAIFYIMAWTIYLSTWKLGADNKAAYIYPFLNFFHPYGVHDWYFAVILDIFLIVVIMLSVFAIYYYSNRQKKSKIKIANNIQ